MPIDSEPVHNNTCARESFVFVGLIIFAIDFDYSLSQRGCVFDTCVWYIAQCEWQQQFALKWIDIECMHIGFI